MNFSELKVIELASVLAGPDVGMFFAELGAKVIKFENKNTEGDVTRRWKMANEKTKGNLSAYFSSVNWNKDYVFLDLTNPIDQEQVHQQIKDADVVITNFKPGSAKKLKMDYTTCKSLNTSIIYGEINGYGSDSPRAAYDVVLQAETGYMSMNGTPDSGPVKMPIALIDVLAAHHLKEGLLIALMDRMSTGRGAHVEVSLYDAALSSLKNQATNWLMNKSIPQRMGSLHPNISPYGETFETKDGKLLVLGIGSNKHFVKMLEILGANELVDLPAFLTNQARVENRTELDKALAPYFKAKTKDQLMDKFSAFNLPIGMVSDLSEVFENPAAKSLVLDELINDTLTRRVKTSIFKITRP